MSKRILWVDNDKVFLAPHILRLRIEGYVVDQVLTLQEGLDALVKSHYDLLILDMMMPIGSEDNGAFSETATNFGKNGGAALFKVAKDTISRMGCATLVFTIRSDHAIRKVLADAGIPVENLMTKAQGADTADFLKKVRQLLKEGRAE